jgi:hypothetical protein
MEKQDIINHTNDIFRAWINDLRAANPSETLIGISTKSGLNKRFLYNKQKNNFSFVSLPTIYLISKAYNFPFELNKYM